MTSSTPTIGTHNGSFHCDEALGVALLRRTAAFADAKVLRSRNQEALDKCDVVIDVGGVYDPAANRFDHHQKEFGDVFGHGKRISFFLFSFLLCFQRVVKKQTAKKRESQRRRFLIFSLSFPAAVRAGTF